MSMIDIMSAILFPKTITFFLLVKLFEIIQVDSWVKK
jgi:hypothetical protein